MAYSTALLKARVRRKIDDDSFDDVTLTDYANDTNRDICNSDEWRFMEISFIGTITAPFVSYQLPTDFQAAINFVLTDPDGVASYVKFMDYKEFDQKFPDPTALDPAAPFAWTFFGNELIIGPANPDQNYTMKLRYYRKPTVLDGDDTVPDVPEEFSELMVLGMARRCHETNDNLDLATLAQRQYDAKIQDMKDRLQSRQFADSYNQTGGYFDGSLPTYEVDQRNIQRVNRGFSS